METTGVPAYHESSISVQDAQPSNAAVDRMDKTNQFEKLAQATGMAVVEECDDAKDDVDIEETVTKPLLSPMIQH